MAEAKKNRIFWYSFENDFEQCEKFLDFTTKKEALMAAREERPDAGRVWIGTGEEISPVEFIGSVIDGEQLVSGILEKFAYEYDTEIDCDASSNELIELEERLIDTIRRWFDDYGYSSGTGVYKLVKVEEVSF